MQFSSVRISLSKNAKNEIKNWISELNEGNRTKECLYRSLRNEKLSDEDKSIIAYNLFNGQTIAAHLKDSYNYEECMEFIDNQICRTFDFEANNRVVGNIRSYILWLINNNSDFADISEKYAYFGLEGGVR